MINSNIDGSPSSGSNQLFEMLALISNPDVYAKRWKELQEATEANKKYVELVAPASDILNLRKKLQDDAAESAKVLSDAKANAEKILANANARAGEIIDGAKEKASAIVAEKKSILDAARNDRAQAATMASSAKADREKYQDLIRENQIVRDDLAKKIADYEAEAASLKATKEKIIAKHEEFLRSLLG